MGPAPKCQALHLRRVRNGNRNPKGGAAEAEERRAAGRRIGPEAVTEHEPGYVRGDARRNETVMLLPADAIRQHSNFFLPATDSGNEPQFAADAIGLQGAADTLKRTF